MLRHLLITAAAASFAAAGPLAVQAQEQDPEQLEQELTEQFVDGFNRGCVRGETPGVLDQPAYCSCLAKAYTSRYNGFALAQISNLSGPMGPKGAELVNLMMAPEMASCADQ
ncbi:Uncharacterized secreted protein [Synechococcus sp. RCC307]|nr:Uncharacterized secreted protein [Synechococcus sp. RCC307]